MQVTRWLLFCGILAAAVYIGADIAAATLFYPGYDYGAQQVSELSAIGAPSRPFWMIMGYPYTLLLLAFAAGVWQASAGRLSLKATAIILGLFALNGFIWGFVAPMHMRGTTFTDTDTMHIGFAIAAVVLILGQIGFGAAALGRGFRIYSALTVLAMLVAGGVVSTQVGKIAANEPTPWMGLVERVSVHGAMVWIAVFAAMLLRRQVRTTAWLAVA